MLRRCMALAAVVAIAAILAAPAGAAAKKTRSFKISITGATVTLVANTDAGVVGGSLGKGAIVINGATTGTFTTFYAQGTIKGTFSITPTPNPDMSASYTGSIKVTGGTGAYAGASGKGTISGLLGADGSVTGTATGKITY